MQAVVREERPLADSYSARSSKTQTAPVQRMRQALLAIKQSQQAPESAQRRAALQMSPLRQGVHRFIYITHARTSTQRRAAIQMQALRQSVRFPRGTRQPRQTHAHQSQAMCLQRVREGFCAVVRVEVPHEYSHW